MFRSKIPFPISQTRMRTAFVHCGREDTNGNLRHGRIRMTCVPVVAAADQRQGFDFDSLLSNEATLKAVLGCVNEKKSGIPNYEMPLKYKILERSR